jgi:hypothetical protein
VNKENILAGKKGSAPTKTSLVAGTERAREMARKGAAARKAALIANPSNPTIKMTLRTFINKGLTEEVCIEARNTFYSLFKDPSKIISALQYISPVPKEDDEKKNVVSDQDMEIIKWFRSIPTSLMEKINEIAPPDDKDPS